MAENEGGRKKGIRNPTEGADATDGVPTGGEEDSYFFARRRAAILRERERQEEEARAAKKAEENELTPDQTLFLEQLFRKYDLSTIDQKTARQMLVDGKSKKEVVDFARQQDREQDR